METWGDLSQTEQDLSHKKKSWRQLLTLTVHPEGKKNVRIYKHQCNLKLDMIVGIDEALSDLFTFLGIIS